MVNPQVNIILLNYNGWKDTIECLESLQKISYKNYKLIVVDNNSTDESLNKIKKWCRGELKINTKHVNYNSSKKPIKYISYTKKEAEKGGSIDKEKKIENLSSYKKIVFISSERNLGFAGGNNIAIKYSLESSADYIMLLNNDTVVEKDFLQPLINTFDINDNIGIVGGKIYFYDDPKEIAYSGGEINLIKGSGYHYTDNRFQKPTEVSFITGCLWLVNPALFKEVGFLDKNYFLYLEDTDFCYKTKKSGYKLIYNPNSIIYHKESNTIGKLSALALYYSSRNRPYFVHKNSKSVLNIFLFWLFFLPTRIIRILNFKSKGRHIFKGIVDFLKMK